MPRHLTFFSISLALALTLGCQDKRPRSGEAPILTLKTYAGETMVVDGKDAKATLLVFWATWCGPCIMEMPSLIALNAKLKDRGFRVISINVDDPTGNKALPILKREGVDYPVLIGDEEDMKTYGGIEALPTSFLISSDGILRDKIRGLLPEEELERRILSLL